jgi:hypothetical protein
VVLAALVLVPGCSANPGYVELFQEFTASVARATQAMNGARDAASLKQAVEVLAKETETIQTLNKKLSALGKPNAASKKAVLQYVGQIKGLLEQDVGQASERFGKFLPTAPVPKDDRLKYGAIAIRFGETVEAFGATCSLLGL